jgi:hypothetical protein
LRPVLIEMYVAPEVQLALFRCGLVVREAAAYRQALIALVEQPFTLLRAPEPQRRYLREARLAGFRQVMVEAYRGRPVPCAGCAW